MIIYYAKQTILNVPMKYMYIKWKYIYDISSIYISGSVSVVLV